MTEIEGPRPDPPAVSFIGIDMSYDREPILHDISFTVRPGSTTVIMGPSGVGKTTLIRILLGLRDPDDGDVTIGGVSVVGATRDELKEIRRDVGVMLGGSTVHDGSIFGSKTAWENVRYPLEVHGYDEATIERRAWQRMIEFDLAEHAHLKPAELSGGTRRRVALARAFVEDPRLIVLDDPGTALDVINRDRVVESIRKARAASDATVILTCHDIPMTKALADDLVVLLAGRVGAAGPAAELLDGVDDADAYEERFSVRETMAQDSAASLALYLADRGWEVTWQRMVFLAMAGLGMLSLIGLIVLILLDPN